MGQAIYNRRQFGSPSHLEQRTTPENPSFNLNDPAAWDALDASPSAAGVPVTHDSVMKIAAVWQGTSMISGDLAKLHLNVFTDEDCIKTDPGHPAHDLVRWDWNDEVIAFHGWRTIVLHALIWGNGYAFIDRNGRGDPIGLYTLLPDRVTPERIKGQRFYVTETTRPDGSPWLRPIPARDVFHLRGMSADGVIGLDWAKYARDCVGTALATEQFQAKYFKSGVRTGGILMIPREMSEKAKNKIEEGFSKTYGGPDNWFKTVILRDGAKFEAAQSSLRDAQMVELDEELVRKVCRFLNMAPSRLGLSDSVSYNSKAEDNQGYLDTTLSPWMIAITGECRKKLLSQSNRDGQTHFFGHDTSQLLRMNALARYQIYAIGRQAGILSKNECRTPEGLPPVDGGDLLDAPTTPAGGGDKGGATPPRGAADPTGGQAPAPRNHANSDVAARRRIIFGIASQARHKSTMPAAFIDWIDGGLMTYRKNCRDVFGNEDLVDEMLMALKAAAATATKDELANMIDEIVTQREVDA